MPPHSGHSGVDAAPGQAQPAVPVPPIQVEIVPPRTAGSQGGEDNTGIPNSSPGGQATQIASWNSAAEEYQEPAASPPAEEPATKVQDSSTGGDKAGKDEAGSGEEIDEATVSRKEMAALLDRLIDLSEFLSDEALEILNRHDLLLRMETLKTRFLGSKGIHLRAVMENTHMSSVSASAVADVFSYLLGFAEAHPNKRIGLALTAKITHIVSTIRRRTHG
jgi:hypothetical protein